MLLTESDVDDVIRQEPFEAVEWIGQEFRGIDLNDVRLNERTRKIGEQFARLPSARINQACRTWKEAKAAYRYFSQTKVTPAKILKPHIDNTVKRMKRHKVVLAVQDTVFLSYQHSAEGLGPIGKNDDQGKGLVVHHAIAFNTQGLPLGTLSQQIWARDSVPEESKKEKIERLQRTPVEEKESSKWIIAALETDRLSPKGVKVISICDREADFYEFVGNSIASGRCFVVRANYDRRLDAGETDANLEKISDAIINAPVKGAYQVEVHGNGKRTKRIAEVEVKFVRVFPSFPDRPASAQSSYDLKVSQLTAISVVEKTPPKDEEPIHWVLLTNEPVDSLEDAREKINWYCVRWSIEILHKVDKSCCQVERGFLRTHERLACYFALKSVIAYRVMLLTYISRIDPEASADVILTESEWKTLHCVANHTSSIPHIPPTVKKCTLWIASLGGFMGRKQDGQPGIVTVARGWQRLCDYVEAFTLFNENCAVAVGGQP